jgi:ABC-2 type transport system permease protein
VAAFACTGLGLVTAGLALRVRETAVLSNVVFGVLLIFCGVNVPLTALPAWMAAVAQWLPLTHGIAAARDLAGGASWSSVSGLVTTEAAIGVMYLLLGLALLAYFEAESRRLATLDMA